MSNTIIHDVENGKYYFSLDNIRFDYYRKYYIGDTALSDFPKVRGWFVTDTFPTVIREVETKSTVIGYELEDRFKVVEGLPHFLEDYDYDSDNMHMYEAKREISSTTTDIDITWDRKFIEPIKDTLFVPQIMGNNWDRKEVVEVPMSEFFDTLTLPEIMLASRPCVLQSKQVFGYLRYVIKKNIDPTVSKVVYDYDEWFEVQKSITTRPYKVDVTPLTKAGKKQKRKVIETRTTKKITVFEMRTAPRDGKEHIFIPPTLKADNHEELKEMLEDLADQIIKQLNTPAEECTHCDGTGIHVHNYPLQQGIEDS